MNAVSHGLTPYMLIIRPFTIGFTLGWVSSELFMSLIGGKPREI
jgi:hypothetical protein